MSFVSRLLCLSILAAATTPALAAGRGERGPYFPVEIRLADRKADLKLLLDLDIDVDAVFFDRVRATLILEEMEKLTLLGFDLEPIPDEAKLAAAASAESIPAAYHTYATLTSELQAIAAARPDLTRLYTLGLSVQGRELWMMKISRNPDIEEDEPEVRYIAAMHGDEVVGKELCIGLIHHLVDLYGTDPRVTALVDGTEIWILPSMNPDGTELVQRYNANGFDLNRNFPDQFTDPVDSPAGRPSEVAAVMSWGYAHSTNLSANFHGGSLVVNYPYDGTASGVADYSASPDDAWLVSVSRTYADLNPPMLASNLDGAFFNGITNGADWYVIRGGMQDWNYVWRGDHEVTIEQSVTKWPPASTLPSFWSDNLDSMLSYFERAHEGVRGIVTDAASGAPLAATIRVTGSTAATYTDPDVGDYHRLLLPGVYRLEISAAGHVTAVLDDVVVEPGALATRRDVALLPLQVNLQVSNSFVLDASTGNGNGVLDPGETSDLALSLRDLGSSAYSVSAWLEAISPYATVSRAMATYPNIPANQTRTSNTPHYAVSVSPSVPVGHSLGFAVHWTAAGASGVSEALFLPVRPRTCVTASAADVPRPIQDRATATSAVGFPADLEIEEVNVYVSVTHPYIGDLAITATSPGQTPVLLHNHSLGSADNVVGWYDTSRAPFDPLERFVGEHATGTWTLTVGDGVPGNTGTLNAWSVEACGRPFETSPPEMKFRAFSRDPSGSVVLDWWGYPGIDSYRVYRSSSPSAAASFADVTLEDLDPTDTRFRDTSTERILYWIVTGVSSGGEGPWGHFGQ